jgi:hypothetical protein
MRRPVRIASRPFLRFIPRERPVGPVAQWLEPAAHNGLVGGSSPSRPTSHTPRPHPLSGADDFSGLFGELSQTGVEFRADRGVIWALRAGTSPRSLPAIFQFPRPSAGRRQRPEFETPESGSKRCRAAAKRQKANRGQINVTLGPSRVRATPLAMGRDPHDSGEGGRSDQMGRVRPNARH